MGKASGTTHPPEPSGSSEPTLRSRTPPNSTGVGRSSSSLISPLRDRVTRTYVAPSETLANLRKSLDEPVELETQGPPSPPKVDEDKTSESKDTPGQVIIEAPCELISPKAGPPRHYLSPWPRVIPPEFPTRVTYGSRHPFPSELDNQRLAALRAAQRSPRCRALLISNNAPSGNTERLLFVEDDVDRMMQCLIKYRGVKKENILIVKTEGDEAPVRTGFAWLHRGAIRGDTLVLMISSHVDFNEQHKLAYFLNYNSNFFRDYIRVLPRGCNIVILLETCHGINLVKVEYVVKQMWAKSATITTPLSITMGASPAVVSASPPLAKTIKENMEGASAAHVKTAEVPGSTGAQSYHPPIASVSRHRTPAVCAAPYRDDPVSYTKPAQPQRRLHGLNQAVTVGDAPADSILGANIGANVTLFASEAAAYESSNFRGEPARNGVLVNAFCTAVEKGHRACSAIYNFMERMINRENEARAKRDLFKTAKELAALGPRDQLLHLRSTSSDVSRVLAGDAIPMQGCT